MPIRSLIALLIVAALLATGAFIIMAREGAAFSDFMALLQLREGTALCIAVAWACAAASVAALLTAFAAFLDGEDEDGFARRGFPKGVPVVFLLLALALFWMALNCAAQTAMPASAPTETEPAVETPIVSETVETVEPAETVEPSEPDASEPAPEPQQIVAYEAPLVWEYMYPLIRGEDYVYSPAMSDAIAALFPANDPQGEARAMLCGKAWVAFAGSASEEGPRDRNERRARRRAELIAGAASDWLDGRRDCQRPIILAVSLGQHAATTVTLADGGRSTGYQRQLIIVSRERAPGEAIGAAGAASELRAFLRDEDRREAMLGGRRYLGQPEVLAP